MEEPLLSVIVPFFNSEKYLYECLSSIVNQTYKNLEIICVDDGSTDNGYLICASFAQKDKRVRLIRQINGGVSKARNAGLDCMTGEFFSLVDSDDTIDEDMYKRMIDRQILERTDAVVCGYKELNEHFSHLIKVPYEASLGKEEFFLNILKQFKNIHLISCINCNKLYKTSLLDSGKSAKVRFREDMRNCEDAVFSIEALNNAKKISMLDFTPYNYRKFLNENSLSKTNYYDAKLKHLAHLRSVLIRNLPGCEAKIEKFILLLDDVAKCKAMHNAFINKREKPFSLKIKSVLNILIYSKDNLEKASSVLLFMLPAKLYRYVFNWFTILKYKGRP